MARRWRLTLSATLAVLCALTTAVQAQIAVVGDGGPGPVKAQHLTAELMSLGPAIAPGGQQLVGLVLTMEDHWHVYWVNAGDSGEPPKIDWTLPEGFTAGPMQFPIPDRLPLGPLMDYGYEYEVAFPVRISAPADAKSGPAHLDAQVSWLVCADVCVPGKAHLGLDLDVKQDAPALAQEPLIGALGTAMTLLPKPLPPGAKFSVTGDAKRFAMTLVDGKRASDADFFPYASTPTAQDPAPVDAIANAPEQGVEALSDGLRLFVQRSPDATALPEKLSGIVRLSDSLAYEVSAPVEQVKDVWAASHPNGELPPAGKAASLTTMSAIALAFAGGILLNLMPCVFPVLFLKGLSLVQSAAPGEERERGHLLRHGFVYAAGILVSFWAIVVALLALRATGSHIGWGFQLQSPAFLAVLSTGMFFLALSLAGQFDLGLSLTSVGGGLAGKQGYAGSFFTGVLATVVATPCAAPFMGAAVGFALAQTAAVTFAVFTALALGLAAPYLLLSWQPAWVRVLPKPGAWMEILKQLTSVPLFATALLLVWVYGQIESARGGGEGGVTQMALLLAGFLLVAIAGWALGRWPARRTSTVAALLLIALGLAVPLSQQRKAAQVVGVKAAESAKNGVTTGNTAGAPDLDAAWQPYSQQTVQAARAAGRPVFIDFTAAWCISCQVNERVVLKTAEVEAALRKGNVVTMKADWTNEDPAITQELASLGRASVPTYVIYPAAQNGAADVLPELLTKDLVLKAIERNSQPLAGVAQAGAE
ncbi:MAG TPA: thioredoxin family protein [Acidobacteriaceae bacterium]|nr:thioredoxin family protein [Acidobacteriaceae bacterium]